MQARKICPTFQGHTWRVFPAFSLVRITMIFTIRDDCWLIFLLLATLKFHSVKCNNTSDQSKIDFVQAIDHTSIIIYPMVLTSILILIPIKCHETWRIKIWFKKSMLEQNLIYQHWFVRKIFFGLIAWVTKSFHLTWWVQIQAEAANRHNLTIYQYLNRLKREGACFIWSRYEWLDFKGTIWTQVVWEQFYKNKFLI